MATLPNPEEAARLRSMGQLTDPTAARLEATQPAPEPGFLFTPERLDELKAAGLGIDDETKGRALALPQAPLAPPATGTAPAPLGTPTPTGPAATSAPAAPALGLQVPREQQAFRGDAGPVTQGPTAAPPPPTPLGFGPTDVAQGLDSLPPATPPPAEGSPGGAGAFLTGFAEQVGKAPSGPGVQLQRLLPPGPPRQRPPVTANVIRSDRGSKTDIVPVGNDEIGEALLALTR